MKAHIGITSELRPKTWKTGMSPGRSLHYTEGSMVDSIVRAGALPALIPITGGKAYAEELADWLDGLLLPGGEDVSPAFYGERPLKQAWKGDKKRTHFEFALLDAFRRREKPVLCICRGSQILNVYFGGSLYQDIFTQKRSPVVHRDPKKPLTNYHKVRVAAGTLLEKILGRREVSVASGHHQGIRRVGKGLTVSARAEDGLVEALECPKERFTLAVQFHPEWLPKVRHQRALMEAFIKACR